MSYYTALITAYSTTAPQPPTGYSGTAISSGMTTQQKIAAVDSWMITGSVPTSFFVTGNQLANCVNWTEFTAISTGTQDHLLQLFCIPGPLLGGSSNTGLLTDGMILASFPSSGITVANLTALAQGAQTPWWVNNGYSSPVGISDIAAAGLST